MSDGGKAAVAALVIVLAVAAILGFARFGGPRNDSGDEAQAIQTLVAGQEALRAEVEHLHFHIQALEAAVASPVP